MRICVNINTVLAQTYAHMKLSSFHCKMRCKTLSCCSATYCVTGLFINTSDFQMIFPFRLKPEPLVNVSVHLSLVFLLTCVCVHVRLKCNMFRSYLYLVSNSYLVRNWKWNVCLRCMVCDPQKHKCAVLHMHNRHEYTLVCVL